MEARKIKQIQKVATCISLVLVLGLVVSCALIITTQKAKDKVEAVSLAATQTAAPTPTITPTPKPTATKNPNRLDVSEIGTFEFLAEEAVKLALKAPATAEFPGAVFGQDEWHLGKRGDVVTVQSWVDAENSFGAKVRNDFTAQFGYSSHELLYLELSGEVVWGSWQEP